MKRSFGSLVAVVVSLLLFVGCTDSSLEQSAPETDLTVGTSSESECSKCSESECTGKSECSATSECSAASACSKSESACSKTECAGKEECSLCESECKGKAESEAVGHEGEDHEEDSNQ